jgi:hypothetical protein
LIVTFASFAVKQVLLVVQVAQMRVPLISAIDVGGGLNPMTNDDLINYVTGIFWASSLLYRLEFREAEDL